MVPIRLRIDLFNHLMADHGFHTIVDIADALGINRSTIYNLRNGGGITLDLAMHIARFLGRTVEQMFEPVPDVEAA